ncbi:uncharacterized protein FOMMEDRAFT_149688 [Fomitiporia mediterranea MF3/22]|uniref:uncharacterized protein n=1 Tax=Fomitiporia mediterranea (strain MF3/22) TaxID=694068 RepID=UPI0004408BB0|nr:uncharacterized protein FOMMEDRAFT_149688 [Fomitiporia mediterranea MF3/22]EJD07189.1 hypothetical protein FOMMEDRAFT_149688 [Fomitiporia mediterranea MF3/22]
MNKAQTQRALRMAREAKALALNHPFQTMTVTIDGSIAKRALPPSARRTRSYWGARSSPSRPYSMGP